VAVRLSSLSCTRACSGSSPCDKRTAIISVTQR
jgi:hypothetical protein